MKLLLAAALIFSSSNAFSEKGEGAKALKAKHEALAPEISLKELRDLVNARATKPIVVIDANGTKSYKEGHIPSAIHFAKVEGNFAAALPADKNTLIVAYCGGPMCTAWEDPAEQAKALGYKNLRHLKAGIKGWKEAKYETEKGI